jgi:hypothetical protein
MTRTFQRHRPAAESTGTTVGCHVRSASVGRARTSTPPLSTPQSTIRPNQSTLPSNRSTLRPTQATRSPSQSTIRRRRSTIRSKWSTIWPNRSTVRGNWSTTRPKTQPFLRDPPHSPHHLAPGGPVLRTGLFESHRSPVRWLRALAAAAASV